MTSLRVPGRIACTPGVSLSRRNWKETDRLVVLYTEEFGKVPARFIGVNRPRGKLKALSEPMVWGEYRLHVRPGSEFATVLGGSLISVFPGIRSRLEDTLRGLEVCELLDRLTPAWQPNQEKYALVTECLDALQRASKTSSWLTAAFALRLLKSAGFGYAEQRVSEANRSLWAQLHAVPLAEIAALPDDPPRRARLEDFILRSVQNITDRPLRAAQVRQSLCVVETDKLAYRS